MDIYGVVFALCLLLILLAAATSNYFRDSQERKEKISRLEKLMLRWLRLEYPSATICDDYSATEELFNNTIERVEQESKNKQELLKVEDIIRNLLAREQPWKKK
jgi:hypothetical protein